MGKRFRTLLRSTAPILLGSALSCGLSNMAARQDSPSLSVHWENSFESACRAAAESGRPILLVMAAGDLRDKC